MSATRRLLVPWQEFVDAAIAELARDNGLELGKAILMSKNGYESDSETCCTPDYVLIDLGRRP